MQALPLPRVYPSRAPVLSCAHFLAPATQAINLVILRTFTFDVLRMSVDVGHDCDTTVTSQSYCRSCTKQVPGTVTAKEGRLKSEFVFFH